jgi:small subunit ribosomal protein S13
LEKTKTDFRGIVRVAGKDMKGDLPIAKALNQIKGMGVSLADSIATIAAVKLNIDKKEHIGNLTDDQLDELEKIVLNPVSYGVPVWMVNRRKDSSGTNRHLIGADLDFAIRQDIEAEKNIKSYRGVRHMFGLPVRGQRTKTMGRRGMTLGVVKKKVMPTVTGKKEEGRKGKK